MKAVVVEVLATAPSSPVEGQMYYNSTDGSLYFYNGASWVAATGNTLSSTAADIKALGTQSAGSSTSVARADHVHPTTGIATLNGSTFTGAVAAPTFTSNTATGTAPLTITSTTAVTNLNVDMLDGYHASSFSLTSHNHTLDGLSNVSITSNANGEILKWNGTSWINNTLSEAGIEPSITKLTAFNKNYGTVSTDVKMDGVQSVGSLDAIARIDHIHPTDTSRSSKEFAVAMSIALG